MSSAIVRTLRETLYRAVTLLSALVVGGFFGFFAFGLGLFVPAPVARPLAFLTTAVFSALGAAWASNALAPDGTRSRLLAVLGRSLIGGAVVAAVDLALVLAILPGAADQGPAAAYVFLAWLVLGLVASFAAWALRSSARSLRRDALVTLVLALGAILFVVGAVAVTCTLTPCIP